MAATLPDTVRLKLERAKWHLEHLERRFTEFGATDPFRFSAKGNPRNGVGSYVLTHVEPLPDDFALIIGDAVHNLRTTFDHLVHLAVPVPTPNTGFPVRRSHVVDVAEWNKLVDQKLRGAPAKFISPRSKQCTSTEVAPVTPRGPCTSSTSSTSTA